MKVHQFLSHMTEVLSQFNIIGPHSVVILAQILCGGDRFDIYSLKSSKRGIPASEVSCRRFCYRGSSFDQSSQRHAYNICLDQSGGRNCTVSRLISFSNQNLLSTWQEHAGSLIPMHFRQSHCLGRECLDRYH